MAAQIEATESDMEFMDGISPSVIVTDSYGAVKAEIEAYGRQQGADRSTIGFAQHRARNALHDGRSGSYAYSVGRQAIDDLLEIRNPQPISTSYQCAKGMGVVDLQTTADGVMGKIQYRIGDKWYWFQVRVEAVT